MNVTFLTVFAVAPGQTARFLEIVDEALDGMRQEAGFCDAALHREMVGEGSFLLSESWSIRDDDLSAEMDRRFGAPWHGELQAVLARPIAVTVWAKVREERQP